MRDRDTSETPGSFDPVALTLALWLGVMVGVGGMVRLSVDAAAQSTLTEAAGNGLTVESDTPSSFNAQLLAVGG